MSAIIWSILTAIGWLAIIYIATTTLKQSGSFKQRLTMMWSSFTITKIKKNICASLHVYLFAVLPLLVLGPLLNRGYILQFDMVFTPNAHVDIQAAINGFTTFNIVFTNTILHMVNFLLPMDIIQKLILLSTFFLSSLCMYKLMPTTSTHAKVIASLMYAYNPFVYDRFMAGHWRFLIAYAITPYFLALLLRLFRTPTPRKTFVFAAVWAVLAAINAHHIIVLGLLVIVFSVFYVRSKKQLLHVSIGVITTLLLSSWWLLPLLLSSNFTDAFDLSQLTAFRTRAAPETSIWVTLLSLQGFWHDGWRTIYEVLPFWLIAFFGVITPVFIGLGAAISSKENRKIALTVLLAGSIAMFLAAGLHPETQGVNEFLFENIPGLKGLREPQKMLSITVIAFALFTSMGIEALTSHKKYQQKLSISLIVVAFIAAMAWPLFWAGNGQLKTHNYPNSWYVASDLIDTHTDTKIIVLPWSQYTISSFNDGQLVVQPAKSFFGPRTITNRDIGINDVIEWENPERQKIAEAVDNSDTTLLLESMREQNAQYVILASVKDRATAKEYDWIKESYQLEMLLEDKYISLYRLTN